MDSPELDRLLSLVEFRTVENYVEGLDAFRHLIESHEGVFGCGARRPADFGA